MVEKLVSLREAARVVGVPYKRILGWTEPSTKRPALECQRRGGRLFVDVEALRQFMAPGGHDLRLAAAAALFQVPRRTMRLWCREGYRGVKLDHARHGELLFTSKAAVEAFLARASAIADGGNAGDRHEPADVGAPPPVGEYVLAVSHAAQLAGVRSDTVRRWATEGLPGSGARLQHEERDGTIYTSRRALRDFLERINGDKPAGETFDLPASEAAKRACVSTQTFRRWCDRGCCGVELAHGYRGTKRFTSAEALDDFLRRVEEHRARWMAEGNRLQHSIRTLPPRDVAWEERQEPTDREREVRRAEQGLDRGGFEGGPAREPKRRTPTMCLHKATNRAYVWMTGKRHYLGRWGSPEAREAYERLLAEVRANGGTLPPSPGELTVMELLERFWHHAVEYYRRPDGGPSRELDCLRYALRPLKDLYGGTPAGEFGTRAFKTVRDTWIRGHVRGQRGPAARGRINRDMQRVKGLFKWAVAEELVPAAVHETLRAIPALKRGRSDARETEPVQPVPQEHVAAIRPYLSRQVRALVDLQLLTGARPGEVTILRPCDVERSGDVWLYRPAFHKNAHRNHDRTVFLGPKAQAVLRPFLLRADDAYCFAPREAVAERVAAMHAARRTPPGQGNEPGTNRKGLPRREPGGRYSVASYGAAIARGCAKASAKRAEEGLPPIPRWGPHRLRHTRGTEVRARHGIEAAQVVLGHAQLSATEIYAEKNLETARRLAALEG